MRAHVLTDEFSPIWRAKWAVSLQRGLKTLIMSTYTSWTGIVLRFQDANIKRSASAPAMIVHIQISLHIQPLLSWTLKQSRAFSSTLLALTPQFLSTGAVLWAHSNELPHLQIPQQVWALSLTIWTSLAYGLVCCIFIWALLIVPQRYIERQ